MRKDNVQWLIPVSLAIAAVLALWFYWAAIKREPPPPEALPEESETSPVSPVPKAEPVYPLSDPNVPAEPRPALPPLPALEVSDESVRLSLTDLFGESLAAALAPDRLIERITVTLDNLPREHVAERMRPLSGIGGQLVVESQDDSGEFLLVPENYSRYDALLAQVAATDVTDIAGIYRRFYPLMQEAYINLGYPDGYFNDRVVEVIDHLLATPDVSESPVLVRPNVLYEYADEELEQLSSGQKLLIRMGPEHRETVKAKLAEFRELIAR